MRLGIGRARSKPSRSSFVRRDAPPMLLMHGTADTVVQPRNSERLAAALTAAGATAELKLYPGKSHIDTIKSLVAAVPRLDQRARRQRRFFQAPMIVDGGRRVTG